MKNVIEKEIFEKENEVNDLRKNNLI